MPTTSCLTLTKKWGHLIRGDPIKVSITNDVYFRNIIRFVALKLPESIL